ncbi:IpaB/EvcA family protein [Paucilactobacillus kaifaensis]|uniref:IpaB/EvcA family protein n=1 Tax=Paucilactobacillus kaifaensis TaxID=2559921 RepID=UPI0010F6B525|nr:IpaB/EvcA family protein [Paucilactobacillus kaifaensis]
MAEIKLNKTTQSLLDQVNKVYPGTVLVHFGDTKTGYLRHDQAKQEALTGGLVITVTDVTAPNYTASHELLHLLMLLSGFPQIFFNVTFGDDKLDEQLMIMATDLYDIAMHLVVVAEQRKHQLIDQEIETLYLKGIDNTITVEKDGDDDERTLRLLTLLDAMVFYGDHFDQVKSHIQERYPQALQAAQKLYHDLTDKPIDSPFSMRRTIVKLFKQFDDQLTRWHLPALHNNEFTTLSSVLSERQLRLEVRQMFEIFHSEMIDRQSGEKAYIGLNRNDRQNSFVLTPPKDNSVDFFKDIYSQSVKDLFETLKMPYIVRK